MKSLLSLFLFVTVGLTTLVQAQDYAPIGPFPVLGNKSFQLNPGSDTRLDAILPNTKVQVVVYEEQERGELDFVPVNGRLEEGRYRIFYDYVKYSRLPIMGAPGGGASNSENGPKCFMVLGIGLRFVASIDVKKIGLDVKDFSNLAGLAAAFDNKQFTGSVRIERIGFGSKTIEAAFPTDTEVSTAGIDHYFNAIKYMQAAMYDRETVFYPQLIGLDCNVDATELKNLVKNTGYETFELDLGSAPGGAPGSSDDKGPVQYRGVKIR